MKSMAAPNKLQFAKDVNDTLNRELKKTLTEEDTLIEKMQNITIGLTEDEVFEVFAIALGIHGIASENLKPSLFDLVSCGKYEICVRSSNAKILSNKKIAPITQWDFYK